MFAAEDAVLPIGALVGLIFILCGLAFKLGAVPFHMWTPDVYEGAPTPVTAFFAAAPKVAAIGLTLRVVSQPFGELDSRMAAGAGAGLDRLDAAGCLRRHRPDQHQAADGLFRHRPHGLRPGGCRRRQPGRHPWRADLYGDLSGDHARYLCLHPDDAPQGPLCRNHRRSRRPVEEPAAGRRWRSPSSCSRWPASRRWPASSASSTSSWRQSMPA